MPGERFHVSTSLVSTRTQPERWLHDAPHTRRGFICIRLGCLSLSRSLPLSRRLSSPRGNNSQLHKLNLFFSLHKKVTLFSLCPLHNGWHNELSNPLIDLIYLVPANFFFFFFFLTPLAGSGWTQTQTTKQRLALKLSTGRTWRLYPTCQWSIARSKYLVRWSERITQDALFYCANLCFDQP